MTPQIDQFRNDRPIILVTLAFYSFFVLIGGATNRRALNLEPHLAWAETKAEVWSFGPEWSLFADDILKDSTNRTISNTTGSLRPRAFEARPLGRFPCFLEDPTTKWWKPSTQLDIIDKGFFFLKTHKTGSSAAAGIHLRIASRIAKMVHDKSKQQQTSTSNSTTSSDYMPMCQARFDHSTARKMKYNERKKDLSFLWTILRDPTQRALSSFFHFEVSRRGVEPTDENMRAFLFSERSRTDGYYHHVLSLKNPKSVPGVDGKLRLAQAIIDEYDFIAITERMDESVVVLQMLLGLETADVLFLNAKVSFDAGGFRHKCTQIQPKNVTTSMEHFLRASAEWQQRVEWDRLIYDVANKSLDLTIKNLGKESFNKNLAQFQRAKAMAEATCNEIVQYPCSADRSGLPPLSRNRTDCLWKDSGCGGKCLDEVAIKLGLMATEE